MKCTECKDYKECHKKYDLRRKRVKCSKAKGIYVPTNADRIRAMTDEELAGFLNKCEARGYQDSSIARDASDHCIDMLDWLQQPCGGADHVQNT